MQRISSYWFVPWSCVPSSHFLSLPFPSVGQKTSANAKSDLVLTKTAPTLPTTQKTTITERITRSQTLKQNKTTYIFFLQITLHSTLVTKFKVENPLYPSRNVTRTIHPQSCVNS
jgi:hypothetical protein